MKEAWNERGPSADEAGSSRWRWQEDQSAKKRQGEELVMEWISVKDRLPEEGQLCWTLERYKLKRNGYYSCVLSYDNIVRRYCTKESGARKPRKNPWGTNTFEVWYWIPIPPFNDAEGCDPRFNTREAPNE